MPGLDFWFDFASTYSYPAALRVRPLARQAGVEVRFRPFLLGPIFKAQGWDTSPFNIYEAKGRYMWRDMERVCGSLGLAFRRPSRFPERRPRASRGRSPSTAPGPVPCSAQPRPVSAPAAARAARSGVFAQDCRPAR